ncbi:MAG: nucleotidyl transferase AbiEii/AbiGii toxin family protein [Planctomycetes bacterium]|nr:nucleotidyl transferase AbiEii/AbiGii toxin family protein [Planctomycetota bacterium]
MLTREELQRAAADGGFDSESYEKVSLLVALLEGVRSHPYLGPRMVLKGGTALNLFVLDLPRLSVDIDLNYVGAADRATMLAERPLVERAIEQVCGRQGVTVKRVPSDHAGGKWRLSYASALGSTRTLELDVNFVLRTPLWPIGFRDCQPIAGIRAMRVPVLDIHELAAGKLAALFARSAARDLFDARGLLRRGGLDAAKLRLGFVVYGGANRRDWREVEVTDVTTTPADVDAQLVPMLRAGTRPKREDLGRWTEALIADVRTLMAAVLPLTADERSFLDRLNGAGEIVPELVTQDPAQQALLLSHPGLRWKAQNVREHLGRAGGDEAGA